MGKKPVCTESPKTLKSPTAKGAESKAAEPVAEPPAKVVETSKTDEKMPGRDILLALLNYYTIYIVQIKTDAVAGEAGLITQ